MELVQSYLNEVSRFLAEEQREDVLPDLRDAIEEEVFAVSEEAGREPTEDDERAVLAGFGHPLKVANRYQPQRSLIGPDLYPAYRQTLRVVLSTVIAAFLVVALVLAHVQDWTIGPWSLFWTGVEIVIWVAVVVTLVFVATEYSGERFNWYDNWRPEMVSPGTLGVIDRSDVLTNLVSEGVFLLWWNDVLVFQNFFPAFDVSLQLSPVWDPYLIPLNVVIGLSFLLHVYVLVAGVWRRQALVAEVALFVAVIAVGIVLLFAGDLIVVEGDFLNEQGVANVQRVVKVTIMVIAGFTAWDIWVAAKMLLGRPI